MAINVDLSKPLSAKVVADLRTRLPEGTVQRYIELAGAEDEAPAEEPTEEPTEDEQSEDDLIGDEAPAFDPGEHNVGDVREYLSTASDEETARVLDLERNGKARSSLLEG